MQERKLTVGDPIVITGPNEFEGKTGEIYEFSPSGKFVIVDLYNHGKHSMHLSDIEYNQYADQEQDEEDDWYDEGLDESVNPQFINAQVTKLLAGEARRMTNAPMAQLLAPVMKQYNLTLQQIDGMVPGGLKRAAGEYGIMMKEGWSDAMVARRTGRPRTPYSVYINGKKWKDFANDDHAEAVANKLRAKFKADGRDPGVITIAPTNIPEDAATPPPEAPRPAIIAPAPAAKYMVKKPQAPRAQADDPAPRHAKGSIYSDDETTLKVYKPEQYREAKADSTGSWVVYNGNKVMKFKTHGGAKAYAEKNGGKVASSEFYADKIQKQGVAETALNPQDPQGDYAAKRKALHDLSLNKDVDQAAVQQRRLDLDREAEAKGVKEGRLEDLPGIDYVRPGEIKRKASGGDHNPYPYSKEEDEDYFREIFRKKREAAAKTKAQGGSLNELSTEKLAQYKKAAGADASTADKRGDIERGNKRFKGIVKATIKQGNNDAKKHSSVAEAAMSNLHADLADVYNRMAPGIERNRDSFKAGQLYDALEAVAEQHGAEAEFKRMMTGARNRAHMDYDTNPGGFQNWFWYLPFGDEVNEGLLKEPTNRKEYLDQRDKLFRMMSMETNPANKQIIKQAINDLEARYGNLKNTVKEEYSTDSEAVERAILNRIMVAHTDLLMKFGPEKVMQAAEEVAYNVGDVDEIGTSDVSAYVNQVKQILGVPEEVNEKWSQKYKSSINCANPKGFSQKAHCAGRKK
jgi:translation initiation factor 2 alpha subunit (eIF-2alpha)